MDALKMAVEGRRPGKGEVVFHSDRGSQCTGRAFRELCFSSGIIPSVGETGICYDNAAAESWNATFKKELIHLPGLPDSGMPGPRVASGHLAGRGPDLA